MAPTVHAAILVAAAGDSATSGLEATGSPPAVGSQGIEAIRSRPPASTSRAAAMAAATASKPASYGDHAGGREAGGRSRRFGPAGASSRGGSPHTSRASTGALARG